MQTSRGKYDRLQRTIAGSTLCALDGYGLCDPRLAPPTLMPLIRSLSIDSRFCSALPSDPASRRAPLRSATLHLHQVGGRLSLPSCHTMLGTPRLIDRCAAPPRSPQTLPYLWAGVLSHRSFNLSLPEAMLVTVPIRSSLYRSEMREILPGENRHRAEFGFRLRRNQTR